MPTGLPLSDAIVAAIAQLVDDARGGGERRDPTHGDLDFYVKEAGLAARDPKLNGQVVGKAKRVRAALQSALADNDAAGGRYAELVLSKVRACGGFRPGSDNYVGAEAIANAQAAFTHEGYLLADDGSVGPKVLSALKGADLTAALRAYAERAQRGSADAALVTGTGKDLMEATAAHVMQFIRGAYPPGANFHGLLGMAFVELNLATPETKSEPGEPAIKGLERGLFASAIAANRLRNKEGTGHGRPWLPSVSDEEAKAAIEIVGVVSAYLLAKLAARKP